MLLARLTCSFIEISFHFDLIVSEIRTDRQTHIVRTDAPEMIPFQNLLMVNQIVVIASVAASATDVLYFVLLSISIDFNVKDTEIPK